MADSTFNLFGPPDAKDIRVGYISTERGYQKGVGVCEANEYAQKNPGTTFIFRPNRKTVKFLNINQVNQLASNPTEAYGDEACPEGLSMFAIPDPPKVVFLGGGGVGAVANPVIGDDGAILALDMVNGGFGYKYPPITEVRDDSGIGAGAVVKVDVSETDEQLIYYSDKEDFEEYKICDSDFPEDKFGKRWGPDGRDLGKWDPQAYVNDGSVPFAQVVDEYIKKVQNSGKDWWTTRKKPPLKVTSTGQTNTNVFKVKHPSWGKFMNEYAISPVPPSNVKPSDHAGKWYTFEWNVDFPYDGEYIFRGAKDNKSRFYLENQLIESKLSHFKGTTTPIKKTIKAGSKVIRLDLYNQPQMETVKVQQKDTSDLSASSTKTEGMQTREVFNTVDYINKANRQLWRTNIYARGGFLNDYGICPFDTTLQLKDNPYAGDHKIVWPNVNFPIDGNYVIKVAVDDNVELSIGDQVNLTKKGFTGSDNTSTGTLKTTRFIKGGNYNITAKLHQIPGGAFGFKARDGKTKTKIKFNANVQGNYGNRITIPGLFSLSKDYKGSTSLMNREIEVEVGKEYDVILSSIRSRGGAESTDVRKGAIRFRTTKDGSGGISNAGPRLEYEDRLGRVTSGDHGDIIASVSQGRFYGVNGNRCKFMVGESMKGINPMSLAIDIETEFAEKEIQSKRSWNENPMGVALTIDSPAPPIPQEPVPQAEGRCPNNPFWTTRFPGAKERWYPVRFPAWGSLMNEFAMSPLPPDDEGDSRNDTGSFRNTWTKEFPYGGWYKVIMAADNWGELWIDSEKVIDMTQGGGRPTFTGQREKLIYIDGPTSPEDPPVSHDITVVVENEKSAKTKTIDAKVFNTLDWISGGTAKAEKKRVNFKITSSATFANGIKISGLDIAASKRYNGSQINKQFVREVEVNKVYDVEVTSTQSKTGVRLKNSGESVLVMEEGFGTTQSKVKVGKKNVTIGFTVRQSAAASNKIFLTGPDGKTITFDSRNPGYKQVKIRTNTDYQVTTWSSCKEAWIESQDGGKRVGLDDCKPGGDNDYNDLQVTADKGLFFGMNRGKTGKFRFSDDGTTTVEKRTGEEDWNDIMCAATEGRFFDFKQGANKATCKYMVSAATRVSGGVSGSTTRSGVTYMGPHLFHYQDSRWGKIINREGVSPIGSPSQSLSESNDNILGKKVLTWKDVDFPQTAQYDIFFVADNGAHLFIDGKNVLASKTYELNEYITSSVQVGKGKHDIRIELDNASPGGNIFLNNPTGVSLKITTKRTIGTGEYRPWSVNPMGVAAKLIPPPCPKKVKGKGKIINPVINDPGNGYKSPKTGGYPVLLKLKDVVIKDPGINYNCAKDKIRLEPSMGSEISLCQCGPFGKIEKVCVESPGLGFTRMPDVIVDSDTGVNLDVSLVFEPEIAPFDVPDVIQVTDLVGLKQTGYYKGRPYYGAVFYENGVKYSGWYKTAGELVQVYDTLQESIDAEVTTPPSAILRQGSDTSSNDPRLNIPGTPENLT